MVSGGVTPLINAATAKQLGYKIVIWSCFAMTAAYLAYQQVAQELRTTGAVKFKVGPDGKTPVGIRDIFEICGLSKCADFDREMGGRAFDGGV